ncbi:hypothetical protein [Zunongwangia sp. H14]|uniref:hypothetical protein n=1 Tax=Zunongwangia sp. H14 TaxID=3240792 RepID=UPI0035664DBF
MKNFLIKGTMIFLTVFSFVSCKEAEVEKPETPEAPTVESSYLNKEKNTGAEVTYNPPHGKPNHRCDLPVGAPLGKTAAVSPSSNQSPVRLKSATPKINPPHGEPGHDCSIPVGAELN